MSSFDKKRQNLFIVLMGIFLTNALLAEMVGIKIFSLEQTLNMAPAQLAITDNWVLDFNLTAGVVLWPVVFITTDIINEYFGKKGVRKITLLTVAFIIYAFLIIAMVTRLSPAQFWLDLNSTTPDGQNFDVNYAFNKIYLQAAGIIIGSLVAFLIGQFLDVFVFHKLRYITGSKMLWLRATGSTLISQLIDSFVVLTIAFYFLAPDANRWTLDQVFAVGTINYIYKFIVAVALTPLLYLAHGIIDRYLGRDKAEEMMEEAASNSQKLL